MKHLNSIVLEEKLTEHIDLCIREGKILGAACQVTQSGKPVSKIIRGIGRLDTGEPVREDHIFRLASMTKNITGAAILQQIEKGRCSLDTKVSEFFPGFSDKWVGRLDENGKLIPLTKSETPMTLRHLVTHTNGLGSGEVGAFQGKFMTPEQNATLASAVDFFEREVLLDFNPGSRWGYSGLWAFSVICRIIEMLSDMPYDEYVRKNITGPLGMPDTVFVPSKTQWKRFVTVLAHDKDNNQIEHKESKGKTLAGMPLSHFCGGGSMVSTLSDYVKFAEMLLAGGIGNGKRILSEKSVKLMGTPLIPQAMEGMYFPNMTFGACCLVRKDSQWMPEGCFGWGGGYGTHTWVDPDNKISVVMMKNTLVQDTPLSPTGDFAFEKAVYRSFA